LKIMYQRTRYRQQCVSGRDLRQADFLKFDMRS
jgi:hypothetical protein